jgi:hypothetical protein
MNTKLHAISDADGRPLSFFMTAGQVSDYTGAAALHPGSQIAQRAGQVRQAALPVPQPHRDHVRPPERLAPRRKSLRPMPHRLLLRHRPRCHRNLLAMINES